MSVVAVCHYMYASPHKFHGFICISGHKSQHFQLQHCTPCADVQGAKDTPCLALQISSASAAREAMPELCIAAGTCGSAPALPSDIQAGVDAVRQSHQARPLPWLGWQPQGRCIVHSQHASDVVIGSRTGSVADAESER